MEAVDDEQSQPAVPPSCSRVSDDVMLKALREEVRLASTDWLELTQLYQENKKKPLVVDCETKIQHVQPAVCFPAFLVVLAHSRLTIDALPRRRRNSTENEAETESEDALLSIVFHTLHFAHNSDPGVGYEVQSVWVPGSPLRMQCYPRLNLQFALMHYMRANYGMPPPAKSGWDASRLQLPQHGSVVILGMGGNVMGNCLVRLLPPTVPIHVVEIEPSVVAVCMLEGLVPTAENFKTHVCDVSVALSGLDDGSCSIIVLDCFDPLEGDMMAHANWLRLIRTKLGSSSFVGVLIVNMHCVASPKYLTIFAEVFGGDCVEVLEVGSHPPQVAIVCTPVMVPEVPREGINSLADALMDDGSVAGGMLRELQFVRQLVLGYRTLKFVARAPPTHSAGCETFNNEVLCNIRVWKGAAN